MNGNVASVDFERIKLAWINGGVFMGRRQFNHPRNIRNSESIEGVKNLQMIWKWATRGRPPADEHMNQERAQQSFALQNGHDKAARCVADG